MRLIFNKIKKHRSKKVNIMSILDNDILKDLKPGVMRMLLYLLIKEARRTSVTEESFTDNQTINLSYVDELTEIYSNKATFYESIKTLVDLDIISKVDNTRGDYLINPKFINCSTHKQNVLMGITRDYEK